jgi:hypothetical protein
MVTVTLKAPGTCKLEPVFLYPERKTKKNRRKNKIEATRLNSENTKIRL